MNGRLSRRFMGTQLTLAGAITTFTVAPAFWLVVAATMAVLS